MTPHPAPALDRDDPAELSRFLRSYTPTSTIAALWPTLAEPFTDLVLRAGAPTRLRVEKDIQALASIAAYLHQEGRNVTLDDVLSASTLAGYDSHRRGLGAAAQTRENHRGMVRRLHAAHQGLPWRRERRPYEARVAGMVPREAVDELADLLDAAHLETSVVAKALLDVVAHARSRSEDAQGSTAPGSSANWRRATQFAASRDVRLTKLWLSSVVTHERLLTNVPLAVLHARHAFSRRDLELGLTHIPADPGLLSETDRSTLRG